MSIEDIIRQHNRYQDSLVESFRQHLAVLVGRASAATIARLSQRLGLTDGLLDRTGANSRLLRTVGRLFDQEMTASGYDRLVSAFVGTFDQQFTFMHEILNVITADLKAPLPRLTPSDPAVNALKANAEVTLQSVIDVVGAGAIQRTMFAVGGLPFTELAATLSDRFQLAVPQAVTLADTAQSTFYRTITDRQFQRIEQDYPDARYRYMGPDDKVTRPFCEDLLKRTADRPMTRAQIDGLDNGQLPDVFATCGGWRCRHQFVLVLQ